MASMFANYKRGQPVYVRAGRTKPYKWVAGKIRCIVNHRASGGRQCVVDAHDGVRGITVMTTVEDNIRPRTEAI